MESKYKYGQNQLMILAATAILAPALRLFPAASAASAGGGAWASVIFALPPLLLLLFFLCRIMDSRQKGEGLAELILRRTGPIFGRIFLVFTAAWLLLYGGFALRAGANRQITTVYPNTSPLFFSVTMGFLGLLAALGSFRTLARFSKMIAPAVFGVLILVLFFSFLTVNSSNLTQITALELPQIAAGSIPAVDVVTFIIYIICFPEGMTDKKSHRFRSFTIFTLAMLLLLSLLSVAIIGNFGAELTAQLTRPFFSLSRNLVFFGNIERIEALVVSLWVFPDFLLFSLVLFTAANCIRLVFGYPVNYKGEKLFDFSSGRFIIWICAAASVVCSAFIGKTPDELLRWSLRYIPYANLLYAFAFLPFVFFVAAIKKHAARD